MATCPKCGKEASFWSTALNGICKECQAADTASELEEPDEGNHRPVEHASQLRKSVNFEVFKSSISSWETLFANAAAFANQLAPDCLINISHSVDMNNKGIVTVWYWQMK